MHKAVSSFAALAAVVTMLVSAGEAQAAFATFVSGAGSNANNCTSPATPCQTLSGGTGALAKTDEGGVIHVLPGDYSAFTVDKAVEIIADGGEASITFSAINIPGGGGSADIVVNAGPDDKVLIRGFVLSATGTANGVALVAGGALHLENCTLTFPGDNFGVVFRPTLASELYVSNSTISGSGGASAGGGIQIRPTGFGSAKAAFDNLLIENNRVGILVDGAGSTGAIDLSVADTTISGSTTIGIGVFEAVSGGSPSAVAIARTTISNNGGQGIFASRSLATVRVRQSEITGNAVGVQSANGGQIISHGDNVLAGNTTNGAFTATLAPQ